MHASLALKPSLRCRVAQRATLASWVAAGSLDSAKVAGRERRLLAGSVVSRASLIADLCLHSRRDESQLPGSASYSHCRPFVAAHGGRLDDGTRLAADVRTSTKNPMPHWSMGHAIGCLRGTVQYSLGFPIIGIFGNSFNLTKDRKWQIYRASKHLRLRPSRRYLRAATIALCSC